MLQLCCKVLFARRYGLQQLFFHFNAEFVLVLEQLLHETEIGRDTFADLVRVQQCFLSCPAVLAHQIRTN